MPDIVVRSPAQKRANINLFFFTFSILLLPLYYSCNSKENLGRPLSFSNGGREQVKNMEIERQTYCCELAAISRQEKKTFHEPIIISFGAEEEEEEIKIKSWSYY